MLGRSREDSESRAERETIALLRSAHQADVEEPCTRHVVCWRATREKFWENPSCVLSRGTLPLVRCSSSGLVKHRNSDTSDACVMPWSFL